MYSREERIKAIELYIKYDKSAAAAIHELGYPDRHTLRYWYTSYLKEQETGIIRDGHWSTTITLPRRRQLHFPKQERAGTIGQERSKRGFAPVSLTFCPSEAYLSLFHPLRSFS